MSINTDYDQAAITDMLAYKTFALMDHPGGQDARMNDLVESRIVSAVKQELIAKGYEEDMSGKPDFLVGYHIALQGKLDIETVNQYYGYGHRYGFSSVYTETQVRQYTEGTLLLDIVDGSAKELVWRGQAQAEVYETSDVESRKARIKEAVRRILERFPPEK
jgi:hypothetical protein